MEIVAKCLCINKPCALVSAVFLLVFKILVLCHLAYFAVFIKETTAQRILHEVLTTGKAPKKLVLLLKTMV